MRRRVEICHSPHKNGLASIVEIADSVVGDSMSICRRSWHFKIQNYSTIAAQVATWIRCYLQVNKTMQQFHSHDIQMISAQLFICLEFASCHTVISVAHK
jgi:hypothetical protein